MKAFLFSCLILLVSPLNLRNTAAWDFTKFYNDLVSLHNTLRTKHRVGKLTKLQAIATMAQKTATNCAKIKTLQHSQDKYNNQPVGQNLYVKTNAPSANDVMQGWYYKEEPNYNYSTGKSKNGGVIGHFTQVVWKSTTQIGCAVATGTYLAYQNSYYVCCNYFPAGNYIGQYVQNVRTPSA